MMHTLVAEVTLWHSRSDACRNTASNLGRWLERPSRAIAGGNCSPFTNAARTRLWAPALTTRINLHEKSRRQKSPHRENSQRSIAKKRRVELRVKPLAVMK